MMRAYMHSPNGGRVQINMLHMLIGTALQNFVTTGRLVWKLYIAYFRFSKWRMLPNWITVKGNYLQANNEYIQRCWMLSRFQCSRCCYLCICKTTCLTLFMPERCH
jgi:hypothetical protein